MARVDVIVLNYNGKGFLGRCIESLRAQTYLAFQTVLVDNSSTDDSIEYVRAQFPEVRIIPLPENAGFCAGNNRGIEATSSEYVALLNNDTEVAPEWLEELVRAMDQDPKLGSCASKLIRISDRTTIDSAGDVFYTHGVGGKRGEGQFADCWTKPGRVFGACAGAALYRRTMLEEIGGFDELFYAHDEDVDLSFRAQLRGYQCQYVPAAIVYHHVGGSFRVVSTNSIGRIRRNMLEVLIKNMPTYLMLKHLLPMLAYYIGGDISSALRGHARAILSARWQNLRRLRSTMTKRRAIQHSRVISNGELEAILTPSNWTTLIAIARSRYQS